MKIKPMGPNLFLAVFSSESELEHVLKGGLWWLSKHAILLKVFDPKFQPMEVVFDQHFVWAHIMHLDFALMNSERGKPLAGRLGEVEKLEVDEDGRAWGLYLRARVKINPNEPLMRCISVFSQSKNTTLTFVVMYERLPMFCFSCGLIGHSSLLFPSPAERDSEGKLPWNGDRLCVPEQKKRGVYSSDQSSRSSWNSGKRGSGVKAGSSNSVKASKSKGEATSPVKKAPRGQKTTTGRTVAASNPKSKDKQ
jgi:hypothetical protein